MDARSAPHRATVRRFNSPPPSPLKNRRPAPTLRVLRHFYQESLNPRYFGLVCLMFGAAAAGLIIAIGYRHGLAYGHLHPLVAC